MLHGPNSDMWNDAVNVKAALVHSLHVSLVFFGPILVIHYSNATIGPCSSMFVYTMVLS